MQYKGQVALQTGQYFVTCHALNNSGESIGECLVAYFDKWDDAFACLTKINDWDSRFQPDIWSDAEDKKLMDTCGPEGSIRDFRLSTSQASDTVLDAEDRPEITQHLVL